MAAALLAREGDFRLIAEQCSDIVMRVGLDERILYASPSCARILGWDPARLLGTSALEGVNPDDRARVEQVVSALKAGEAEEARIICRANHRRKKEIWVETALRVTRSSEICEIDGVVAISRDMTEQKDLQDKLAALATSDGLTGIANRRHFDERLAEEWARAERDGTPLSLLLVDVDHFKKFNDQYGHQDGDACLRARRADPLRPGPPTLGSCRALRRRGVRPAFAEHGRGGLRARRRECAPGAPRTRHAARFEPAVGHLAAHQKRLSQSGQRFREPPSSTNAGRIEAEPVQSYRRSTATLDEAIELKDRETTPEARADKSCPRGGRKFELVRSLLNPASIQAPVVPF
ncbi:sensor domain-containing diguanylate cyclase [Bradyrhizobium vignae]|uniref:sensor domain-containing diguanylate cyclase n=1 Tax=Bradyrhizobium vignae TaxID=1549949 RepID=UPI0040645AB7